MTIEAELRKRTNVTYLAMKEALKQRIVGLEEVMDLLLIGILSGGHCLLVGVPGLAKTLLITSLSEMLDLKFSRVQFTPDLMPQDIVGTEMITEDAATGSRSFQFSRGPVFANILLADEINRTPPKTQAALIEAMEERHVTIGGRRHALEAPFFVLATQNPIEQEGTYPLPAAQLDRFMFMIRVTYPSKVDERQIVRLTTTPRKVNPSKIISKEEILQITESLAREEAPGPVIEFATKLARWTRPAEPLAPESVRRFVSWGVGPRGAQSLVMAAKVRSALMGRAEASIADVESLLPHVFRHRMLLNFHGEAEGKSADAVLADVLAAVKSGPALRR